MASTPTGLLSDALLATFHERAPVYDRENRFFAEDFEDLRSSLLPEVLRRQRGLPLLLSIVWVEVALRLWPINSNSEYSGPG